jgi:hypothetical protein
MRRVVSCKTQVPNLMGDLMDFRLSSHSRPLAALLV